MQERGVSTLLRNQLAAPPILSRKTPPYSLLPVMPVLPVTPTLSIFVAVIHAEK